jgi:hypothetical protein
MLRHYKVFSLAALAVVACSSGQAPTNSATRSGSTDGARASASPRRMYTPASAVVSPGSHCTLGPAGSDSTDETIPVPVDYDGVARFEAVRATSADAVTQLALRCTSPDGKATTHAVDLQSDATFVNRPVDLARKPGRDLPALAGDPQSYSQSELIQKGYGFRPDAKQAPAAYARWLAAAQRPRRLVEADPFGARAALAYSQGGSQGAARASDPKSPTVASALVPETVTLGADPYWTGAELTGSRQYLVSDATFVVPTPIPGGFGTTNAQVSIWGGLSDSNGLIQDGIWMNTSPSAFSLFSFAEYCCGDNPGGPPGPPAIVPNPGDTIHVQAWYCDANGNLNADITNGGAYGCTVVSDETTGETNSCTVYGDPTCTSCPPVSTWTNSDFGNSAEFITELTPFPSWPDFQGTLTMTGYAYTSAGTWVTVGSDPSVELLQDFTAPGNTDHIAVSIPSNDTVSWSAYKTHGFMILSDTNQNLAVNAWGGAAEGTVLRLTDQCTPDNTDCTFTYRGGMLVSDKDPTLAINAWGGAAQGTVLRLSNACNTSTTTCTWTYKNGEFYSDANPSLSINAYGGAQVGTTLELVAGCPTSATDCTWTLPHVVLSSTTNTTLDVNAFGGAANEVPLKLTNGCSIDNGTCDWTFHKGMITSDEDPSLAMNAYGGAHEQGPIEIVNDCSASISTCTWTWQKGLIYSDNGFAIGTPFAMNAYGGAAQGTSLLLVSGCDAAHTDCVFDGLYAGQ